MSSAVTDALLLSQINSGFEGEHEFGPLSRFAHALSRLPGTRHDPLHPRTRFLLIWQETGQNGRNHHIKLSRNAKSAVTRVFTSHRNRVHDGWFLVGALAPIVGLSKRRGSVLMTAATIDVRGRETRPAPNGRRTNTVVLAIGGNSNYT